MQTLRRLLEPQRATYLLVHLVLFIAGLYAFETTKSVLWQGVGVALVAAGITGWVVFVYVMMSQSVSDRLAILQRLGMVAGFAYRGPAIREQYRTRIDAARRQIDVLGFGMSSLREDFETEFQSWKERAHIRILLLDPEFPTPEVSYAAQRDLEEQNPAQSVSREVRHFIERARHLVDDRFQIRLYRCLPSVNVFRVDDELFWGPYLMGRTSRNSPTFILRSGGELFQVFANHFDEIWERHSRAIG